MRGEATNLSLPMSAFREARPCDPIHQYGLIFFCLCLLPLFPFPQSSSAGKEKEEMHEEEPVVVGGGYEPTKTILRTQYQRRKVRTAGLARRIGQQKTNACDSNT